MLKNVLSVIKCYVFNAHDFTYSSFLASKGISALCSNCGHKLFLGETATNRIAYQGIPGAYSHIACLKMFPKMEPLSCPTFADAFKAVELGRADRAMIPVDNSIAGNVPGVQELLKLSPLMITGEHISKIEHCLLGVKGSEFDDIRKVYSHEHAIAQCKNNLIKWHIESSAYADTAGSAKKVSQMNDKNIGAIASEGAAELYGLMILKRNVEDVKGNTTRFLVLSRYEQ